MVAINSKKRKKEYIFNKKLKISSRFYDFLIKATSVVNQVIYSKRKSLKYLYLKICKGLAAKILTTKHRRVLHLKLKIQILRVK